MKKFFGLTWILYHPNTLGENLKEIAPFGFQKYYLEYELACSVISLLHQKLTLHLLKLSWIKKRMMNFFTT